MIWLSGMEYDVIFSTAKAVIGALEALKRTVRAVRCFHPPHNPLIEANPSAATINTANISKNVFMTFFSLRFFSVFSVLSVVKTFPKHSTDVIVPFAPLKISTPNSRIRLTSASTTDFA